jgi:hypothetical protein
MIMRIYKCVFVTIWIVTCGTILSCGGNYFAVKGRVGIDEAKIIANKALRKHGYNPDEMGIIADRKNSEWKDYVSEEPSLVKEFNLENKNYWAIYYFPIPKEKDVYILGGDTFVFVDSNNGDVLYVAFFE